MSKKFDYCIAIGRYQPFHKNHKSMIDHAMTRADKVIVLFGTANRPRTIKNPFTVDERQSMVESSFPRKLDRLLFGALNDCTYNDQRWAMGVQNTIDDIIMADGKDPDDVNICITGNKEDFTSWYIDMFPQWDYIEPKGLNKEIQHVHASNIRDAMFGDLAFFSDIEHVMPEEVCDYIKQFIIQNKAWGVLRKEYEYIQKYKKSWEAAPYAPTFVTTDAVVIQSGHILLVKRRAEPGKGLWALPGGFLDRNETVESGMLRELLEETKIKVPLAVLKGSIKKRAVYDHVERSLRGRTITNAFLIELPSGKLPRVKGSDDAEKAKWIPIAALDSNYMFEDHYDIIRDMLGI